MVNIRGRSVFFSMIFLPAFVVVLFLTVYPVVNTIYLSFFDYNYLADEKTFIGLENFRKIGGDTVFRTAYGNTVLFAALATIAETLLGIVLALLFHGDFPGRRPTMITIIFPMMISTMVVCAVWRILYHYDAGLLNYLLRSMNLEPVGWLIDKRKALLSVVLVDIWQWTPFAFLVIQAGLNALPRSVFEAADIDGAGYFQKLFGVTLPMIASQILLVVMLRTIDTFRLFGKVYALTGGGPGNATETVSYYIYREGFSYFNLGRAAASAMFVLIGIALIAAVYIRGIMKEDY